MWKTLRVLSITQYKDWNTISCENDYAKLDAIRIYRYILNFNPSLIATIVEAKM